jgi:hypothetical protein
MYAIFTLDGLDQLVETKEQARREASDLAKLGCDVWAYSVPADFDVELWADANPDKRPTRATGCRLQITRIAA